MVITHCPSSAFTEVKRLNIGLQSFLSRSSRLKANILEQIRPSQSQRFRFLLNRFYPSQDDFAAWNHISEFQRTKLGIQPDSFAVNALYPRPKGRGFYGVVDKFKCLGEEEVPDEE